MVNYFIVGQLSKITSRSFREHIFAFSVKLCKTTFQDIKTLVFFLSTEKLKFALNQEFLGPILLAEHPKIGLGNPL